MKVFRIVKIAVLIMVAGCASIPKVKYSQAKFDASYEVNNDTLTLFVANPHKCPLRIYLSSRNEKLHSLLEQESPLLVAPSGDTSFVKKLTNDIGEISISLRPSFGDPAQPITPGKVSFPFPDNRRYRIIQGYDGKYSHNNAFSRYAIDFSLAIGDTVSAADNGYVVGVIEEYKHGGSDRKWRDYANFITIYHPHSGLYTQYVHLQYQGSLVSVGDSVVVGQPIGLSGKTGWTDVEHLHFNVLRPNAKGMESVKIDFRGGIKGASLRKNQFVKK